jgi:hypothetical protein
MKTKRLGAALVMLVVLLMAAAADAAVEPEYALDNSQIMGANPLPGVPEYIWWYGCSPTAGGMMVGYWDGKPGYENLFEGDASYWWGESDPNLGITGTRSIVAGTAHIVAGIENGYTYGDWHNSVSYPAHEANPDSLADFMHTVDGGTLWPDIAEGLEEYVEWDNPNTVTDESGPGPGLYFDALVDLSDVAYYGGSYEYADFKAEIDADHPVLLGLRTYDPSEGGFVGHCVVGYGYQDDMFTLRWWYFIPPDILVPTVVTVGGYAVMDTWGSGTGTAGSEWVGPPPGFADVDPIIDGDGVEWWPFLEYGGVSYSDRLDWMITGGISMDIRIIPEPASVVIWSLVVGMCVFAGRQRRRKAA